MAKESLREAKITEIPSDETILAEGILYTMSLYSSNLNRYPYKYVFTNRGIWMRSKKFLWLKPKVTFLDYNDIDCYKESKYGKNTTFIFYPANGKRVGSRIFFDDLAAVTPILQQYMRQKD